MGVVVPEEVNQKTISICIELKFETMTRRQRLTLQVLDEIFIDPLSENDEEDHLEEDYSDFAEFLPELNEEVPNEVTDTRNELVCST